MDKKLLEITIIIDSDNEDMDVIEELIFIGENASPELIRKAIDELGKQAIAKLPVSDTSSLYIDSNK